MFDEREIKKLVRKYGEPQHAQFEFRAVSDTFASWVRRLTRRRGEIVLVVPRGNGNILLHTKPHYPEGIYRLPTGGIHKNEAADVAALREGYEEIGFHPKNLKWLGLLENIFWLNEERLEYPSFVFRTEPFTRKPNPTDPDEPISGFMEADVVELRAVAHYLSSLPMHWHEWGAFRAASHTWLAEQLQG